MRKFNAIEKWLKGSLTVTLLAIHGVFRRKTKLSLETAQVARHYEIVKMRYKLFE